MAANYHELEFTHFVIDNSDGAVFGSARVNGSGRIANLPGRDCKKPKTLRL